LLKEHETKITRYNLKYLDKLIVIEEKEKKEREEKTRQEAQLFVSISETLAPADTPQVYSLVDLFNPFENLDFVVLFANYNPLDPFWSDQGISSGTLQTSQGS
jgi:hypothetical protein